jgi:hypothetical protein
MSENNGHGKEEMIAESRLDHLLDTVAAPEPSATLRNRLYDLGAGRRAPSPWARLGGWFATGPMLRPVGGMAALACSLLVGVAIGYALPDGTAPDRARPLPVIALPSILDAPLVVAGLFENSVEGINLVAPPAAQPVVTELDALASLPEEDSSGGLPLY